MATLFSVIFLAQALLFTQIERPGVVFLSIPAGARPTGMGSSYAGDGNDPVAIQYNPGAIGFFNTFQLAIMNQGPPPGAGRFIETAWLKSLSYLFYKQTETLTPEPPWLGWLHSGMRYLYGVGVVPIKKYGTIGLNYTYLSTGLTDVIDPNGNYIGSYQSYDFAVGITYGMQVKRIGMGITVKYIYSFLCPDWIDWIEEKGDGYSFAIDYGIQYRFRGLNGGLSLLNLGPDIKYEPFTSSRLPTRLKWGISIEPIVMLDSLFFPDRLSFKNIKLTDLISVKYNLDRSYDFKYLNEDIWHGSGWEFGLLNYIYYRMGSFEWMGKSNGLGINFGIYAIDISKFYGESYHVQITISTDRTGFATDGFGKRKFFTICSAFIAPGASQYYKGDGIKGTLFFLPSLVLANYYFKSTNETTKFSSLVGIGLLYFVSTVEALH